MGDSIVIIDSFALPVQGTETRVNAADAANEYMVEYIGNAEKVCIAYRFCAQVLNRLKLNVGRERRTRYRVVPLTSWIWLLAVWY